MCDWEQQLKMSPGICAGEWDSLFWFEVLFPGRRRNVGDMFEFPAEIGRFAVSHHFGYFYQGVFGKVMQELLSFINPQGVYPAVEILLFFTIDKLWKGSTAYL